MNLTVVSSITHLIDSRGRFSGVNEDPENMPLEEGLVGCP